MVKLGFYGAASEVTGSAHLVTLDTGYKILLDCGLFQGNEEQSSKSNRNWEFDPGSIDCVILSHAHIDHCGRLPKLVKDGFKGDIYCTPATRSLALIMLLDSAKIQEADSRFEEKWFRKKGKTRHIEPLYDASDVYKVIAQMVSVSYRRWHRIKKNVEFIFHDAGHILGSASVTMRIKNQDGSINHLGFTGDVGRPDRPILKDPELMPPVDVLICESTYGSREHQSQPNEYKALLGIIKRTCIDNSGKLLIPAFSLGRTQELVYMLNKMHNEGLLPKIPVYVDSPLSVNATRIFKMHPECYDEETTDYIEFDPDPFGFNGLKYITEAEQSKALNHTKEPCIIISSSGMANAGRIRHHLYNNLQNQQNTVLIVGYCAPGTLGAALRDGETEVNIFGDKRYVRAKIEIMDSFSAHADREELYQFIRHQKKEGQKLFLVHGNAVNKDAFKLFLNEKGFENIIIPTFGNEYNLFTDQ